MSTRSINTTQQHDVCDVCERTLLRGEQTEVFVNGGRRYSVCELCKPHALHEGWMREGTIPNYAEASGERERRRSLFGRPQACQQDAPAKQPQIPDLKPRRRRRSMMSSRSASGRVTRIGQIASCPRRTTSINDRMREPRHVHAIPSSENHRISAAVDVFNRTEHRRTVAGSGAHRSAFLG